jgi:uncharacterized protein YcbX
MGPVRVAGIWRYPVKSMVGGTVESAELSLLGIAGDRHWAVRSLEWGGVRGAKKIGALMQCAARELTAGRPADGVEITLPNGTSVLSGDADTNERLSAALAHRVELVQLPADGDDAHFRRGPATTSDPMGELRAVFGREDGEPLPDFSAFPPEVASYESPPGTHHDCWPLMVMSTSAVRALRDALPGSDTDIRRFRPSMVVDTGDAVGHPEFSWSGRTAAVGSARIEFLAPCPRCVMTTLAVGPSASQVPADRAVLRHIVRDLGQNLGVYARVTAPGTVSVGDAVTFV